MPLWNYVWYKPANNPPPRWHNRPTPPGIDQGFFTHRDLPIVVNEAVVSAHQRCQAVKVMRADLGVELQGDVWDT